MAGQARALLVIGTSGEVFPAAQLPQNVRRAGGVVIEVSPGPTFIEADHRLSGEAGRVLPRLAEMTSG
jgi:NAD-dependent deacetylase